MKLTVLCDNYTIIDRYLLGEPALSFHLKDEEHTILFDTGYSDVAVKNAETLNIDLSAVPVIALSHGHDDHTRGLLALQEHDLLHGKTIVAHPQTLLPKFMQYEDNKMDVGAPFTKEQMEQICALQLSDKPFQLSPKLWFLGQIPRHFDFEHKASGNRYMLDERGNVQPDDLLDDSALAYLGSDGITIITGCSHSGICNICHYAQTLFDNAPIVRIIGGFHLFDVDERLQQTINYLESLQLKELYPCHCVSLAAKIAMAKTLPVKEVGTGDIYHWE